jgi:hypothetical protein
MRMILATLALLALFAAEPTFAGCGSHGGGYNGGYRSRVVKAPVVVKKVAQTRKVSSSVRTASVDTVTPEPKQTASVATPTTSTTEALPAQPRPSVAMKECKEYSPVLGDMITVPCA